MREFVELTIAGAGEKPYKRVAVATDEITHLEELSDDRTAVHVRSGGYIKAEENYDEVMNLIEAAGKGVWD